MRKIVFHSEINPSASAAVIALRTGKGTRPFARVSRVNGAWHFLGNGMATGGVPLLRIPHTLKGNNGASEPLSLGKALLMFRSEVEAKLAKLAGA